MSQGRWVPAPGPDRGRGAARGRHIALAAAQGVGLAAVVAGTFLPWLGSGAVERDSYAADAAARNLLHLARPVDVVLAAWPFLSLACALALALTLLDRVVPAAVLATVVAVATGGTAIGVLLAPSSLLVRPISNGPVTTLAGSCLVLATVIVRSVTSTQFSRVLRRSR